MKRAKQEFELIVLDHLVGLAKERVARMQRRYRAAGEELEAAVDELHNTQAELQKARDAFTARAA